MEPPVVLVVENEANIREAIAFQLKAFGFDVLEAADGEEGFTMASHESPALILTEITVPKLDGFDLLRRLRGSTRTARIPFVFLTAKAEREDLLVGLAAGANDYIFKPWDIRELALRLWNIIQWTGGVSGDGQATFFSCFISYTAADEGFVTRLHGDVLAEGVRCWKWDEDAKVGEGLWNEIDRAIGSHDKVVLVASKSSLNSRGVNREIERAIREEDERAYRKQHEHWNGSIEVLFPVRLDDHIFDGWQNERRADVLRKVIADARGWDQDAQVYSRVRDRLIRDLRLEPEGSSSSTKRL